eukprot:TRINITY_DN82689_c0_g1_i1.p1 TRINITY_DN82689_c0_g1~~TRINITY_DN82689_c0_g1_i1.p1  ORF type:complete len:319 (+),score=79.94 TRINITY_DN82689_c0_g1_i1:42-998(+)
MPQVLADSRGRRQQVFEEVKRLQVLRDEQSSSGKLSEIEVLDLAIETLLSVLHPERRNPWHTEESQQPVPTGSTAGALDDSLPQPQASSTASIQRTWVCHGARKSRPSSSETVLVEGASEGRDDADEVQRICSAVDAARAAGDTASEHRSLRERINLQRKTGNFDEALADALQVVALASSDDMEARLCLVIARLEAGGQDRQALEELKSMQAQAESSGVQLPEGFSSWFRRARHWAVQPARKNHYRALGTACDCSDGEVRQAYRRAVLLWHPDKPGGDLERFRAAQEAWEMLGSDTLRHVYDFGAVGGRERERQSQQR